MITPENYPNRVRKDEIYPVPIPGGVLNISPGYDFLHRFEWLDAWILKYWDTDAEPPNMSNVMLPEKAAHWLIEHLDIEICSRTFITEQEKDIYDDWRSRLLEEEYSVELCDIDFDAIEAEERGGQEDQD